MLCGASDRLESEDPDMRWEAIRAESTPEKTSTKFSSTSQTQSETNRYRFITSHLDAEIEEEPEDVDI